MYPTVPTVPTIRFRPRVGGSWDQALTVVQAPNPPERRICGTRGGHCTSRSVDLVSGSHDLWSPLGPILRLDVESPILQRPEGPPRMGRSKRCRDARVSGVDFERRWRHPNPERRCVWDPHLEDILEVASSILKPL